MDENNEVYKKHAFLWDFCMVLPNKNSLRNVATFKIKAQQKTMYVAWSYFKYHCFRISCHTGIWNTSFIWNNEEFFRSCLKNNPLNIDIFLNLTILWLLWSSASGKQPLFFTCEDKNQEHRLWNIIWVITLLCMKEERGITWEAWPRDTSHITFHYQKRYYKKPIFVVIFSVSKPFNKNLIKSHHLEIVSVTYKLKNDFKIKGVFMVDFFKPLNKHNLKVANFYFNIQNTFWGI